MRISDNIRRGNCFALLLLEVNYLLEFIINSISSCLPELLLLVLTWKKHKATTILRYNNLAMQLYTERYQDPHAMTVRRGFEKKKSMHTN